MSTLCPEIHVGKILCSCNLNMKNAIYLVHTFEYISADRTSIQGYFEVLFVFLHHEITGLDFVCHPFSC